MSHIFNFLILGLLLCLISRTDVTFVVLKDVAGTGLVATTGRGRPSNEEKKLGKFAILQELRKSLKVNDNQDLLLAVGWSTDDEIREAAMFPEVFGGDVTYKTNNEKRELFLLAGKDRHGKAFTGMRMFLPSGQRWVYRFLYRYAIPSILSATCIKGNNLFLTDGDTDEYIPLHDQIAGNELWKKSKHGLCMFHLLVQSWQKDVSSSVPDTVIGKEYGKFH
jgi:hypothetical protein